MDHSYHIPTDEEAGYGKDNSARRVLFLCTCAICKVDYEVRDGRWLPMFSQKGTRVDIKVCSECYEREYGDGVAVVL